MTKCTQGRFAFPAIKGCQVKAEFSGGDISIDGGLLLLRQAAKHLRLLEAVNALLPFNRKGADRLKIGESTFNFNDYYPSGFFDMRHHGTHIERSAGSTVACSGFLKSTIIFIDGWNCASRHAGE